MILSLESAIEDGVIDVFSHFERAPDFYKPFGVTVNRFQYFDSLRELGSLEGRGEVLPRHRYPRFNMPKPPFDLPSDRQVFGIHIEGSKFSNDASREGNRPIKDMSRGFLEKLIGVLNSKCVFLYVFCAPSRFVEVSALFKERYIHDFKVIAFDDIWASLSCVTHCHRILATDSAIKTLAGVLRIPTIVLAGDYSDPFRDDVFLTPYVSDAVMRVVRFWNIDTIDPRDLIEVFLADKRLNSKSF